MKQPGKSKAAPADASSMDAVLAKVEASLARMREATAAFERKVQAFVADRNIPASEPCPNGGPSHMLDLEASCRKSWGEPEISIVHAQCPMCARERRESVEEAWLSSCGVPRILLRANLDSWRPRLASDARVIKACIEFVRQPRGFLILQGGVGLGKTHLGAAILRALKGGLLLTQNSFLMMLRATYRNDGAPDPVEKCKSVKVLVLDELGISSGGRDEFPALYEVLNHRYGEDSPTVLTTNIDPVEFQHVFGDRIADRLSTGRVCKLTGESWRKPAW